MPKVKPNIKVSIPLSGEINGYKTTVTILFIECIRLEVKGITNALCEPLQSDRVKMLTN